jgi:hypothetical protein
MAALPNLGSSGGLDRTGRNPWRAKGPSMRPWIIVLSSAVGAVVIAVAMAVPKLLSAPPSAVGSILLANLPALCAAALAAYALVALVLTTANLVAGILRVRQHLERTARDRTALQRGWIAALGSSRLQQLAPRLEPALVPSATASDTSLQPRFNPGETRSEVARLHYISLARSHVFSALIVLAAIVGLGLAQDHGSLTLLSGTIPTTSTVLILVGLVLLAILARIAIDVTAEPLLETISQLPTERAEVGLLRRAVQLLEAPRAAPSDSDNGSASVSHQADRLVAVIQQGDRALLDAIGRLSTNTQALGASMQSSMEAFVTAMRSAQVNENADATALPELQEAIEELTAVLQRLTILPEEAEETSLPAAPAPRRRAAEPRLARELRRLLQEIDADR